MIVCWAAKGGSGTTVVACALAVEAARGAPATIVDLAGDVPVTFGLAEPAGPGLAEWMRSPTGDAAALGRLRVEVSDGLQVLARGAGDLPSTEWPRVVSGLDTFSGDVVVDAGTGEPPAALVQRADQALLVVRGCYVGIRRALRSAARPSGLVLIREPGRALGADDVSAALGAPVVARIELDPAIARAVDAGLLLARLPHAILRPLRAVS